MEKKDRNAKPGDSEIVTKKGFLISPPKRNPAPKAAEIESQNRGEKAKNANKEGEKENKRFGKKPFGNRKRHDDKPPKPEKPTENAAKHENIDNHANNNTTNKPVKNQRPPHREKPFAHDKKHGDKPFKQGKNRGEKPATEHQEQVNNTNQHKQHQPEKTHKQPAQKVPSVLGDLGFVSDSFKKRSATYTLADENTPEEKIDYSKAIPLRDQIYPPKNPAKPLTDEDKAGKTEIIGIRFKEAGKIYYFDPDGTQVSFGTPVIVETARGLEYGYTAISNRFVPVDNIVSPLKKIIRIATKEDKERLDANKILEKNAESVFVEKVEKLGLAMTLIGVEYTFDNTKLLFYFAAESRIDFRELVKELAAVFRTRIELRQVGVRDEAKMLGGLGVCGRPLCCKTFLGEFAQVSIKMAKDQNLSLNSSKISGTCGRLLCCLRYEDEVYQEEYSRTPKVDAIVETPEGKGVVVEANPLKGIVRVRMDDRKEAPPQAFHRDNVKILGYIRSEKKHDEELEDLKELEKE